MKTDPVTVYAVVPCDTCGADVGEPCVEPLAHEAYADRWLHRARVISAAITLAVGST